MKITTLYLHNIACFEEETFQLGSVVIIQSANGRGKSTLISSLKYLFGSGHDPDALRAGTAEGEIIATFEDGTQVRAALTPKTTQRMYKPAGGRKWNRSREFIETVSNALSFDPLGFLLKSDKEQVSDILRLMPIDVPPEEMGAALEPIRDYPEIIESLDVAGRSPLDIINTTRKAVYEARTNVHVAADTLEKHAAELATSLQGMTVDGTDWGKQVQVLATELAGIDTAEERLIEKLNAALREVVLDQERKRDTAVAEAEKFAEAKIADIRRGLAEFKEGQRYTCVTFIDAAKIDAREKFDAFISEQTLERQQLTVRLAQAEQSHKIEMQSKSTQDSIARAKKEAGEHRDKQKAMTACLENIDRLKGEIASRLPIPCTIADGRICREENGALVPFSKWNDASRWTLALKIATLCHGQAGFVCIDSAGFDAFDPEHRSAFLKACRKYVEAEGMQFVLASVSDGDLKVLEVTE